MENNREPQRLSNGLKPIATIHPGDSGSTHQSPTASKEDIRKRYSQKRDMSKVTFIPARQELGLSDPNTRKRVVVYCRVSTDGISQTTSFELQKNYYLRYVRKRPDWKLVGLYSDEGITATSMEKRIGLLTMLEDARAGKFDIIVVKNLSRLNRNLMDCMNIIYELRSLPQPVGILFETENMFTLDKNIDFTLQVLSLVAQEESHKKSEAMTSSYQQRFGSGQFTKPDCLGYDSVGINEIAINEEEATTVQLIFMMYLAGMQPKAIAQVLMNLGRKTHTHKYKDGRIREGRVKWTASSVLGILQNERRCGDVLAQKSYTPNYLDHKSKKNDGALPQYYARDQHPAIVSREEFELTQRIIRANQGGWKNGLPTLKVQTGGFLEGFVTTVPNWLGFSAEDYNRASLRGSGMEEEKLQEVEDRIIAQANDGSSDSSLTQEFQHTFTIDSDDYESFPEEETLAKEQESEEPVENFKKVIDAIRENQTVFVDKSRLSCYDLTDCEVARPQLFSATGRIALTLDESGMCFSRECLRLFSAGQEFQQVELAYNPIEQMLIVRKARTESEKTVHWAKEYEGKIVMRRCSCKGISGALYKNMGWNLDYKYRVQGSSVSLDGETILVFYLDEPLIKVKAKAGVIQNIDTDTISENQTKMIMRDGYLPKKGYVPELEDFELGIGPMATSAKKMARSRAIYYDELTDKNSGELHVADLGRQKYDPECIQRMIQKGISPVEGWIYLRGMAVFKPNGFEIFPEEWCDSFGPNFYHTKKAKIQSRLEHSIRSPVNEIPYGWTFGLDLPTQQTVDDTISMLRGEVLS